MLATIEGLRLLVQRSAMRRPHLVGRLERAAFLVLLRPIERVRDDVWRVGSEDGLRGYTVRRGECDCSDYRRHGPGHPCKHRLALFLYRALSQEASQDGDGGDHADRLPDARLSQQFAAEYENGAEV